MQLPNGHRAIVEDAKVRDYLLATDHPIGRFKARIFVALGYHRDHWERLRDDLLIAARTGDAAPARSLGSGQRWTVTSDFRGPAGRALPIVSVWLIPSDADLPRLITAYPAKTP